MECSGWESRGFHGALEGTDAEWESIGRLPGGEVHRVHGWGTAFDGDGYGLYAENAGLHQSLWGWHVAGGVPGRDGNWM